MTVVKKNLTQFEAIVRMNSKKTPMVLDPFFDKMLLIKDSKENLIPLGKEERNALTWFSGMGFAVEKEGRAFGKPIEKEFYYLGKTRTAVFNLNGEHTGNSGNMLICKPETSGDTDYLKLINLKTGSQILTLDALGEAYEMQFIFNGKISQFKIPKSYRGLFADNGDMQISAHISDEPAFGMIWFGATSGGSRRIYATDNHLESRLAVPFEKGMQA
ncbi:hypothetical protein COU37_01580 [Candidatus Micrarchaeota archaeon CG10_big_fil_rev_8_21_14_0_10_45_29]|nr:MAG: hypothetical protein COU37_01580 [Candidatus Micrarchaeota archaeon CG10_big_fil_rev_8_21_14_0_10_45_29]